MGTIFGINPFTDNTDADPIKVNENFNNITNEFNGNIDNSNIKANAGIEQSKIVGLPEHIANTSNPHSVTKEQLGTAEQYLTYIFDLLHPVGDIVHRYSSVNPSTLTGWSGTWERIGVGKMLIGQDPTDCLLYTSPSPRDRS